MNKLVTKAVFPVAGLGSRFLPATKAIPKEMLPVDDKPLIQYAVEEAVEAGIRDLIFVVGRTKNAIAEHFDMAYELETELEKKNKHELLEVARSVIPQGVNCVYVRQAEPLGLGHAVLCAAPAVGGEAFAVILPDDMIDGGDRGALKQMVDAYSSPEMSIVAVEPVPADQTHKVRYRRNGSRGRQIAQDAQHCREAQTRRSSVESRGRLGVTCSPVESWRC